MYRENKILIENAKNRLKAKLYPIENSLGYKIDIDTLTGIKAKVTKQKFYEVRPSDYLPIVVGENAFSEDILTYKDYSTGSDFESGIIQGSTNPSRTEKSDVAIEGIKIPTVKWRRSIEYNLFELGSAAKSGNWSLIEAKERSRFKNWQLGIQKIAFLGSANLPNTLGLLTQSDVNSNTTTIPTFIKDMSVAQFKTLIADILGAYYVNSNNTIMPTHFVIPTNDYLGLGNPTTETYWNKTKLEWLLDTLKGLTGNTNFKLLPLAYAQKTINADFLGGGSGLNRYILYRYDDESLRMDIPIDYVTTLYDTVEGYNYQSVAYAQFTGAKAYRPQEMLYFDHSV